MLVIADGATSKLAMQMGYCTEPPKGVCSRAFIEGGTHNVDFDGALSLSRTFCAPYVNLLIGPRSTQGYKILDPPLAKL